MSANDWKVGDAMVQVENGTREINRVTIVRETPTQWVDSGGKRWSKKTGQRVPRPSGCGPRSLVPAATFDAALAVTS
jgi:hypothetical protein